MRTTRLVQPLLGVLLAGMAMLAVAVPTLAADAESTAFDRDARAALKKLYDTVPAAEEIGKNAKAILVFPKIVRAGFIVGAQYGEGTLLENGEIVGYYNIAAASYGLQAGVQWFAYAMFLMTDGARDYLSKSAGWEFGAGPSVVVVNKGTAKVLTTTTLKSDAYAFVFGQKGLMAGIGLQGSKITKINK
jgi:lipid-binding SYLF domain-containing protein